MAKHSSHKSDPIYLDHNATTPIDPRVAEAMMPYLTTHFGNPSSRHIYGQRTRRAIETARAEVAEMLHASTEEMVFTSGGTEANNTALRSTAFARKDEGRHIIISAIEHPAIEIPCRQLEQEGFRVTRISVDTTGRICWDDFLSALDEDTILVSIMHANNEVGTLQPIKKLGEHLANHKAWLHTDASQSIGKVPINVGDLHVDLLTVAGHKFYAPKGIGALYIRKEIALPSFMLGANHENGRRAGTENILEIVGLGAAAKIVREEQEKEIVQLAQHRDKLWHLLSSDLEDIQRHGHSVENIPNTLHIGIKDVKGYEIVEEMMDHVAASAGSACHANEVSISHVLQAMNIAPTFAQGSLRLSVGRHTTDEEIELSSKIIVRTINKIRERNN